MPPEARITFLCSCVGEHHYAFKLMTSSRTDGSRAPTTKSAMLSKFSLESTSTTWSEGKEAALEHRPNSAS
eukprot:2224479-Amphidinium_carterae.1